MAEKKILIVCGEPSGDLNAAGLCRALRAADPKITISAVGGNLLREQGAQIFYDIQGLAVMGFFDVLKKLPRFLSLQKLILQKIKSEKYAAIILVDFSGFNLRLAKALKNRLPVIYYTSPQVWASRPGRIKTIKKYVAKMLVFFKFEREFYRHYGIEVECLGHPLLDTVKPLQEKTDFLRQLGLSQIKATLTLLPGSRKSEISHVLPVMAKSACLIKEKFPGLQVLIAKVPGIALENYSKILEQENLSAKIVEAKTYDCLGAADFALVCSGTATLETAIMEKPFCIVYKMGLLNYLLYRPQVRVHYIGMVNIVAGRKIIPEFIQFEANAEKIAAKTLELMQNPQNLEEMRNALRQVKSSLGEPGASSRAAKTILTFLPIPAP